MTKTFKIGDIVEANEASDHEYGFTTKANGWRGKVTRVHTSWFAAETVAGKGSEIGVRYGMLLPKYFDLVTSDAAKQSIEIIEGLTVELTAEQLEEVSRKLQSAKDKAKKVPEPKLKVGDWVRNIGESGRDLTVGKAYKVMRIDTDGSARLIDDVGESNFLSVDKCEIIGKLTPFDRAGRKPGEFKVGDIVCVINSPSAEPVGTLFEVKHVGSSAFDSNGYAYGAKHIELVTPVENRVDRAEGADVA